MKQFYKILLIALTLQCMSIVSLYSSQDNTYDKKIDSLHALLKTAKEDTNKVNILNSLSRELSSNNPQQALNYAQKALQLSNNLKYKGGMANSYSYIGCSYCDQSDYSKALKYFFKSLKIFEEIGNKKGIASSYNFIGTFYYYQNNYSKALKYYYKSLKIFKEIGNKQGINDSYNNIGNIYCNQSNYKKALYCYLKSLKMSKELGDKQGVAFSYNNIGGVYCLQTNYSKALDYDFKSLKVFEEIGDKQSIAFTYNNIGQIYTEQGKYDEALKYLNRGLILSKEIGNKSLIENIYSGISKLYSKKNNYKKAYEYHKLFFEIHNSIFSTENTNHINKLILQNETEKKDLQIKLQKEKINNQRNQLIGFITGSCLVLVLAVVIFISYKKISKEKQRSEELLLNILPSETAEELKQYGEAKAKNYDMVTVLFTDFKGFTMIAEKLTPQQLVNEINYCFKEFDRIIGRYNVEKIKTIGDAYMCAGGLPIANTHNPVDVVKAGLDIQQFMETYKKEKQEKGELFFDIRIGIHTGPVVAGIVGIKKFAYDIWGDTVNIASRMESSGEVGKVNISGTTYELVKEQFACTHRGKIEAKNKGEIDMYFVEKQYNKT